MTFKQRIDAWVCLMTVPAGLASFQLAGLTVRLSDFLVVYLCWCMLFSSSTTKRGPNSIESIALLLGVLPLLWSLSAFLNDCANTALFNNARYYFSYAIVLLFAARNISQLRSEYFALALSGIIYMLSGILVIQDLWAERVVLHTYHSEQHSGFNLNNWGFTCCQLFLLSVFLLGKLDENPNRYWVTLVFGLIGFFTSLLSLSRTAIAVSLLGSLFALFGFQRQLSKTVLQGLIAAFVAYLAYRILVSNFSFDEMLFFLERKYSSFVDDLIETRVYAINWVPISSFFDQASLFQSAFGAINIQQHSSLTMCLFYGGVFSIAIYVLTIFRLVTATKSFISGYLLLAYVLNEMSTNVSAYHPSAGFAFFISFALMTATEPAEQNSVLRDKCN